MSNNGVDVSDVNEPRSSAQPADDLAEWQAKRDATIAKLAAFRPKHKVSDSYGQNAPWSEDASSGTFHLPKLERFVLLNVLSGRRSATRDSLAADYACWKALLKEDDWDWLARLGVPQPEFNDPQSFVATRTVLKRISDIAIESSLEPPNRKAKKAKEKQAEQAQLQEAEADNPNSLGVNAFRLKELVDEISRVLGPS